jgi:hypothetical protein
LAEALGENVPPAAPPYATDNPENLSQGDIIVIKPCQRVDAQSRLAIITEEPSAVSVTVAVASNLTWLATHTDPLLDPALTDLPYSVCVFTLMTGPVRRSQVVRLLGSVDDDTMEAILLAQWGEPQCVLPVGHPLLDRALDPRWNELEAEAANFRLLCDARSEAQDPEQTIPFLDPAIFDAANENLLAMDSDVLSVVDVEAIIRGELDLPIEGLMALLDEGMLLGRGPVAEMLIPLIYTALGKVPARASHGKTPKINGHRCRTAGDRALVWTVLARTEERPSQCPTVRTAKSLRRDLDERLAISSGSRRAECQLVA